MNKPLFVSGSYSSQPEHPSDWQVNNPTGENVMETLGGTRVVDTAYRKYEYVLIWDAMSKVDYDDLEETINYHIDTPATLTFTYPKWPWSNSGVSVIARLSPRGHALGSGYTQFYSKVTITLTEVSAR